MEELNLISEKHRNVDLVYTKVVDNLGLILKKPVVIPKYKETSIDEDREDSTYPNNAIHIDTLHSEYSTYMSESLSKINSFIEKNSKEQFEEHLRQRGLLEYSKALKPDKINLGGYSLDKSSFKDLGTQNNTNIEYDYADPEVENEDKKIKEVTDALIEENKLAIVRIFNNINRLKKEKKY